MGYDCVIVGGGAIGCALALRLAQRRVATVVVDPGGAGAEASGAAAGILSPQHEAEGPGPLLALQREGLARHPRLAEELASLTGVDVGFRARGVLALADDEPGAAALAARASWQRALGLRVDELTGAEARWLEPGLAEGQRAALHFPDEGQVDPPRLVEALAAAARAAGVRFEAARVRGVRHDGGAVSAVETDGATLPTRHAVVAAGCWSSLISGSLLPPGAVRPVRGQLVELHAAVAPQRVLFAGGGYLVPRAGGRIVVGSTMEEAGFHKEVTAAGLGRLLALAQRAFPSLAGATVGRSWAGLRPATADGLPYLGATPVAGLWLATGHFRNGILLAPVTADALAAAITGEPAPVNLRPFSVDRTAPRLGIALAGG